MRQPKYFVKGIKGNIEVSKGTFLSIQKRKNEKKAKNKLLKFNSNSYLVKQKIINKKKIISSKKKNYISSSFGFSDELIGLESKNCPDTIETQKDNNQTQMNPQVSEFCLEIGNEIPEIIQKIPNHYSDLCQKDLIQNKIGYNSENFRRPSNFVSNDDETDHSEYFDQNECQQSTWSMINENVQAMALSLSLSVYDHLYGKKN